MPETFNINWIEQLQNLQAGNRRTLARTISYIENEVPGYMQLLEALNLQKNVPVTGITGPPGAGKSTLVDALIGLLLARGKKVAVLCIDPSSPFHFGALLGDRIRMSNWYLHPDVYIRSLATRGSLGGLHPKIIEITDLLKAAQFDHVIIETVGVGQSEVEIAALADTTVVVLVPEGGDEIQTMKAGIMEIADLFVVNKADRPGADLYIKNLQEVLREAGSKKQTPVIKTSAIENIGTDTLFENIQQHQQQIVEKNSRQLLAEKAFQLILKEKMSAISKQELIAALNVAADEPSFNLYRFVANYR